MAVGHWLHDFIANRYIKSRNSHYEPEARLTATWFSTPSMIARLVGLGFCFEDADHYMLTSFAWGLYVFGLMVTTIAVNAYNLDSYPKGSGEVAVRINMARMVGGFITSYFQVKMSCEPG